MSYLIDTCVISEVQKPQCEPRVRRFMEAIPEDGYHLSVLTIGELTKGIHQLPEGAKRGRLGEWLQELRTRMGKRILPIDERTALLWGEWSAQAMRQGQHVAPIDGLIAATAYRHGLRVVTRNLRHFASLDVALIDPWQ